MNNYTKLLTHLQYVENSKNAKMQIEIIL